MLLDLLAGRAARSGLTLAAAEVIVPDPDSQAVKAIKAGRAPAA
jgi:hypothetical protein